MHFLLVRGRAKTWKNCKTWKNAFFAALREGPHAIQRYPSLSQTLEKLQNLEKAFFSVLRDVAKLGKIAKNWKNAFFAGFREGFNAIQRYPSLSQTLEKLQNLEKAFFAGFREGFNAIQRYPSLSQTLEKLQNLEKAFFAVLREVAKVEKIAKPGKMYFLLLCGRAPTPIQRYPTAIRPYPKPWKNCKTWKNAFFAGFAEGPNAIQRYPSLSQTLEKLQNLEKCIFCCFAGGPKLGKIAKPGKMHFLLVSGKAPTLSTLSVLIPDPRKIAKPGKMHFLLLCGGAPTLSNAIRHYPRP